MNLSDFRVVYAGTPDFAVPALMGLIDAGYHIPAVYTQPDRRAGRGRKVQMSPVKTLALEHGLEVVQPQSLREPDQQSLLASYQPDLMVVAAYGQILPLEILNTPVHGCFNIHGSLLPRWRGAAPIHRAIENGDEKTGVTIMQMDKGLDTGDMLLKAECDIGVNTTSTELHDQLAELGTAALLQTLELLHSDSLSPRVQDDAASCYAAKIEKAEAVLDWKQSARVLHRKVCAFNPWPVAQTLFDGENLRIWESSLSEAEVGGASPGEVVSVGDHIEVATGSGVLSISKLQPPGKKAMPVSDFLNSRSVIVGTQLG